MTQITKLVASPIGVFAFAAGIAIATPFTFTERILRDTIPNCCPTSLR